MVDKIQMLWSLVPSPARRGAAGCSLLCTIVHCPSAAVAGTTCQDASPVRRFPSKKAARNAGALMRRQEKKRSMIAS